MSHQFIYIGEAYEVKADHFAGLQRGFLPGPKGNQLARKKRAASLNLDAILVVADELPAAKYLLAESKENLERPSLFKNQSNHISRHI